MKQWLCGMRINLVEGEGAMQEHMLQGPAGRERHT